MEIEWLMAFDCIFKNCLVKIVVFCLSCFALILAQKSDFKNTNKLLLRKVVLSPEVWAAVTEDDFVDLKVHILDFDDCVS